MKHTCKCHVDRNILYLWLMHKLPCVSPTDQLIGALLSNPSHVSAASMVCKEWRERIIQGVQGLELDMNPVPDDWQQRLARLRRMMPKLLRCRARIGGQVRAL